MKKIWLILIIIILAGGGWHYYQKQQAQKSVITYSEVRPEYGTLRDIIQATGTVDPQNRLEIIPPINGRVDQVLVQEGALVKAGEVLAVMSSTDRAALLDAASTQGEAKVNYWAEVYKPTPILAPIAGRVIVRSIEPGQTVNSSTKLFTLADTLIVKAQIDETDIGKIAVGQQTLITLDAYPQVQISGKVNRISYESKTINNVTIYEVEIRPEQVPAIFRSGMSANIEIIRLQKDRALLLPDSAITQAGGNTSVLLKTPSGQQRVNIKIGLTQNGQTEIVSGLQETDIVLAVERGSGARRGNNTGSSSPFGGPVRRR
ncbi:macrolide-specific efflux system MacA [Candidatus Termititenax persephonae]|uniref:Macrolide-specific efflux system MacA n=1 Tax=Candidatus Termititenax persephonae TaxID=2218525 RepID=A0A388TIS0_9BACT|nr:macrolide-specific efflux system MacA [Candidatus Termititenax persephonae]